VLPVPVGGGAHSSPKGAVEDLGVFHADAAGHRADGQVARLQQTLGRLDA